MKKIQTKEDYEKNHEKLKEVSDKDLMDYFEGLSEIYDQISAEIAYRILTKGGKKEWPNY